MAQYFYTKDRPRSAMRPQKARSTPNFHTARLSCVLSAKSRSSAALRAAKWVNDTQLTTVTNAVTTSACPRRISKQPLLISYTGSNTGSANRRTSGSRRDRLDATKPISRRRKSSALKRTLMCYQRRRKPWLNRSSS